MRILALVADIPNPPIGGARLRNYQLWPAIRELGHEVKVIGYNAFHAGWNSIDEAAAHNDGEFYRPLRQLLPFRAIGGLLHSHYERARSPRLAERVDELTQSWKPDVVHAEELRMGFYLPRFRGVDAGSLQTVTLHNAESYLYEQIGKLQAGVAARAHHQLQLLSLRNYEARVIRSADLLFAYSPVDYRYYKEKYPRARWEQTRNGTDARHLAAAPRAPGNRILSLGALSYYANVRGLWWFLDEVWPRLQGRFQLTVAGSGARDDVRARLRRDGIRFEDTPRDLEPLYRENAICIVPLLEGSGTRGRILEACAFQRPVITTARGLEGLDLVPGREGVIVADDPLEFARAIEYWSGAEQEREKLAAEGRAAVLRRYDWSVVAAELVRHWQQARPGASASTGARVPS